MEMKYHDILEQKLCKELDILEQKYENNGPSELSMQDIEKMDKIYHALKSRATYIAMKEAEEYEMNGYSGRRGRGYNNSGNSMNMNSANSYAEGYSQGYAEGISQSGHYPMNNYPIRRW